MANSARAAQRQLKRHQILEPWAQQHHIELSKLDEGQQWLLFAALQVLIIVGTVAPLRRVVGYLLSHSGMDLPAPVIAAALGVTDRAVRKTKALSGKELITALKRPGNRKPKLRPEHAGLVAKFLVEHPTASHSELLAFLFSHLHLRLDRLTLRRFLHRYGLGCLRGEQLDDTPFLSDSPTSAAPSSCSQAPLS